MPRDETGKVVDETARSPSRGGDEIDFIGTDDEELMRQVRAEEAKLETPALPPGRE
jgi:hypothetical protein